MHSIIWLMLVFPQPFGSHMTICPCVSPSAYSISPTVAVSCLSSLYSILHLFTKDNEMQWLILGSHDI